MPPSVSVIIPAHNGEKYLADAIESILAQDYPNYDIWVVDNASKDKTKEVVERYPQVHYEYSEIADTALARNRGALVSKGEYVTFLDQDDTWVSDKLSRQIGFLESNPNYGAVVGFQKIFLEKGLVCRRIHYKNTSEQTEILQNQILAVIKNSLKKRRGIV